MQDSGSLALFKVTARDQGHYKGPSGAFVTYCNISCFHFAFFKFGFPCIFFSSSSSSSSSSLCIVYIMYLFILSMHSFIH